MRRLAVLFGGPSVEHEVSLLSAESFLRALTPGRYDVVELGIDRRGGFLFGPGSLERLRRGELGDRAPDRAAQLLRTVDVAFPILHGPFGEDGTLQGFLTTVGVPFVGSGVLGSAAGMDKLVMKAVFARAGLPQVDHLAVYRPDLERDAAAVVTGILNRLPPPLFVKPANSGSSVGISRVPGPAELEPALREAARFDRRLVVERAVAGREIEVAIIGNDEPRASLPGEVVPQGVFYDYRAKYETPPLMHLPAPIPAETGERLRNLAIAAFRAIGASGLARVDFFLTQAGDIYLNEINTLPGLTPHSMFPKLWELSGISYSDLVDMLINLALERAASK